MDVDLIPRLFCVKCVFPLNYSKGGYHLLYHNITVNYHSISFQPRDMWLSALTAPRWRCLWNQRWKEKAVYYLYWVYLLFSSYLNPSQHFSLHLRRCLLNNSKPLLRLWQSVNTYGKYCNSSSQLSAGYHRAQRELDSLGKREEWSL